MQSNHQSTVSIKQAYFMPGYWSAISFNDRTPENQGVLGRTV